MLLKRYVQDPTYSVSPRYMSTKALSELYSSRPVVTSDIVLFQKSTKSIFLANRRITPAEGLWVIGGARWAGETAEQTAVRKLKSEAGIEISSDRLVFIGVVEFIWPYRREEPKDEGRHDVDYVFGLDISDAELSVVNKKLDPDEYNIEHGLRQFNSIEELHKFGVRENIIDYYRYLFS